MELREKAAHVMESPSWLICTTLLCAAGLGLGGCASTQQITHAHMHLPVKVVVVEAPMTIDAGRLQSVMAPASKKKLSTKDEPIAQAIKRSEQHALVAMNSVLAKQPEFVVIKPTTAAKQYLDEVQNDNSHSAIPQKTATRIQADTGADAILRFRITDYGLTPPSWRTGYITFEVASTLAIATVIAYSGYAAAKAAAGAYLTQEAVEETAEGYAGFWSLDVVYRPVQIEAELIRLQPINIVWKSRDTGLSDTSLTRLTRQVDARELYKQLDQSTNYAVKDIVLDLSQALTRLNSTQPHMQVKSTLTNWK